MNLTTYLMVASSRQHFNSDYFSSLFSAWIPVNFLSILPCSLSLPLISHPQFFLSVKKSEVSHCILIFKTQFFWKNRRNCFNWCNYCILKHWKWLKAIKKKKKNILMFKMLLKEASSFCVTSFSHRWTFSVTPKGVSAFCGS